jgi:hypothetical protein
MNKMIRAFENGTRLATAVLGYNRSGILQVYPTKETFETLEAWKAKYPSAEFKEETAKEKEVKKHRTWIDNDLSVNLYSEQATDTPFQASVRKLYFQLGLADSIRSRVKEVSQFDHLHRFDPGLHIFLPVQGRIRPVYFNRKTGVVSIGYTNPNHISLEGAVFFVKSRNELCRVEPLVQIKSHDQKIVVYHSYYEGYDTCMARVKMLIDAGFYVQFYYNNRSFYGDIVRALYALPSVKSVMEGSSEYDSTTLYRRELTLSSWIAKNK